MSPPDTASINLFGIRTVRFADGPNADTYTARPRSSEQRTSASLCRRGARSPQEYQPGASAFAASGSPFPDVGKFVTLARPARIAA